MNIILFTVVTFVLIWLAGLQTAIIFSTWMERIDRVPLTQILLCLITTAGGIYYLITLVGIASKI
jgi:hypothetical protein